MGQISETPEPLRLEGGFRAQITRNNYVLSMTRKHFVVSCLLLELLQINNFNFLKGFWRQTGNLQQGSSKPRQV